MSGSLVFVHGTGVRDISSSLAEIRAGAKKAGLLDPARVHGVEWGLKVGPDDLDVRPALPPAATRAVEAEWSEDELGAAVWELLSADPFVELRLLAETPTGAAIGISVAADPLEVVLQQRLDGLKVADEALIAADIDATVLGRAVAVVRDRPEFLAAARAAVDPDELHAAVARAVVANLVAGCPPGPTAALYCRDGETRDALVAAVDTALEPGLQPRGFPQDLFLKVLAPLGTRIAVRHREQFMDPLTDFLRDVAFYVRNGQQIRDYISEEISAYGTEKPVVVLAHSLGGIAAVDLMSGPGAPAVDLLVTVGSQAPLLYLMDALTTLSPNGSAVPFTPWLNVFNRSDLLSFYAGYIFPNASVVDAEIDAGVPFPQSHSAYWTQGRLYDLLRENWPR